jgi:hypothetical protein
MSSFFGLVSVFFSYSISLLVQVKGLTCHNFHGAGNLAREMYWLDLLLLMFKMHFCTLSSCLILLEK